MELQRKKEVEKKLNLLSFYFLSKMAFDNFFKSDDLEKLIYKDYAKQGKEKFIESLPKEKLLVFEKNILEKIDKKYVKESMNFLLNLLYIFIIADEKTEFDELKKYYEESFDEIEAFQKKMTKRIFKTNTMKWMFKMTNKEKFVTERINDSEPENFIGKVFRVGIKNKFFTREELIEFYTDYENDYFK